MNYVIYDSDGEILDHLTQWDTNRIIKISELDPLISPTAHFYNAKSTKAIVTECTPVEGETGSFTIVIPNSLLRQPIAVAVAIYCNNATTRECMSKELIRIPMYPRPMPSDYEFEEDEDYINWAIVTQEMIEMLETYDEYTEIISRVDGMTASAHSISSASGATASVTLNDGVYNIDFGIPTAANDVVLTYASNRDPSTIPASGWQNSIADVNTSTNEWLWTKVSITGLGSQTQTYYIRGMTGENIEARMHVGFVADLNDPGFNEAGFAMWNSDTLNSPYSEQVSQWTSGYVLHYARGSNYGTQIGFGSGGDYIFVRRKTGGSWEPWKNYGERVVDYFGTLNATGQNTVLTNLGLDATNIKTWSGITPTFIGNITV